MFQDVSNNRVEKSKNICRSLQYFLSSHTFNDWFSFKYTIINIIFMLNQFSTSFVKN
jgi:hypothetical protein